MIERRFSASTMIAVSPTGASTVHGVVQTSPSSLRPK
jgi:hypothetical protein